MAAEEIERQARAGGRGFDASGGGEFPTTGVGVDFARASSEEDARRCRTLVDQEAGDGEQAYPGGILGLDGEAVVGVGTAAQGDVRGAGAREIDHGEDGAGEESRVRLHALRPGAVEGWIGRSRGRRLEGERQAEGSDLGCQQVDAGVAGVGGHGGG